MPAGAMKRICHLLVCWLSGTGSVRINRRQITQALEAKNLQELARRSIENRPAQRVVTAGDPHQSAFHELPQDIAALDAANGLHVGAHDGLAIAYDGERFQGSAAQTQL